MRTFVLSTVSLLTAALPLAAGASTLLGNPNTGVIVDDGADVYVHSVKAYRCSSGFQLVTIGETLDQGESSTFTLDEDDFCDVVVRVRWDPSGSIEPVAVTGFDVLSIDDGEASFRIELDESLEKARIP